MLFADLTSFTTFSEGRDAEDVRQMLSKYFASARRIITSYGGEIEKFIGDAVMAVWGAPVAREDDAERAVRAALDLVAAITSLGDRLGVELRLRAGVLTGEAAVDVASIGEGMVIGDAVNTAARLQSIAEPGTVLVDDTTRQVTERAILYQDAGLHTVKGKAIPVRAWRPLRVVAAVGGAQRGALELPLVGRDREVELLRNALDHVLEPAAKLTLLSVLGEAGLGKSRLAWELEKYADGLAAQVLWHHGQASSFGQGVGFRALGDMVRMRAKISLDDGRSLEQAKVDAMLDDLFAKDLDTRERVGRAVRRLLGLDDGSELIDRGELFSSWRTLFERLALRDPVVMLFDDLQWADQGLFDFIGHLADWAASSPILILVFSRPDQRLVSLVERGTCLELEPLEPAEIEALVGAAVSDAPAELLDNVRDNAGGVPLFAVESLRMLADRGVMVAEGTAERYRLVGDVRNVAVPPSIQALIAARLDGLAPDERHVLLDAAVLGQRFRAGGAAALSDVTEDQVRLVLDRLVGKQFLALLTDPGSPERGLYVFSHRQVQRVALGIMSKARRRSRHLAAAEWLAQQELDPDAAALYAGHLVSAADADPTAPDAESIRDRALAATLQAARRAASVGALREAIALFDQAAEIDSDERKRAQHMVEAARCAEQDRDHVTAAEHYARAGQLHEAAGRAREALALRARELYAYRWTQPAAELVEPLRSVHDGLADGQDAASAAAGAALAGLLYGNGEADAADTIAADAARAARTAGAQEELGLALNWRGAALVELGRPAEALEVFREALAVREQHAPAEVPFTLGNVGISLSALGRFEEAAGVAADAVAASERVANRASRELALLQLARTLYCVGRWDEALGAIDQVASEMKPANAGTAIGPPLLIALARGELDTARAVIDDFDRGQALSAAAFESDYRSVRQVALAQLEQTADRALAAIVDAGAGDYAEWPAWLPVAVDLLVVQESEEPLLAALTALRSPVAPKTSPHVNAQIERLTAHVAARAGDAEVAGDHWRAAGRLMSEAGVAFDAAVLALELAEYAPSFEPQLGDAVALRDAVATLERLRAERWLARARRSAFSS